MIHIKADENLRNYYRYGGLIVVHGADESVLSVDFKMPDGSEDDLEMDIFAWLELINYLVDSGIKYLTITGGDPFDDLRLANDVVLISRVYAPNAKIILNSERRYEEAVKDTDTLMLVQKCDYYFDDRFINIKKSLEEHKTVLAKFYELEVPDGDKG